MRSSLAASLFLTVAACTSPGSSDHVHGTIALDTRTQAVSHPVSPGEVRMALAWYADPSTGGPRTWIFQDVPIIHHSDTWPMEFELAITEPPPAGAIHFDIGYSQAKFVAYRDDNGNGQLDWTPADADHFVDEVVAYHPHLFLWYFDDGGLKLMLPGSSDLVSPSTPVTLLERSDLRSSCHLIADGRPRFSLEAERHSYPNPDEGDQGPYDTETFRACPTQNPVPGSTVACQPGTPSDYAYYASWPLATSAFLSSTCGPVIGTCAGSRSGPTAPGPWPCPCDPNTYTCVDYQLDI